MLPLLYRLRRRVSSATCSARWEYWQRNTWGLDCIPLLETFDFSPMRGDWGYRFLISGDGTPENAVFVTFVEGYRKAIVEMVPVTLKGTFSVSLTFELLRAVFLPSRCTDLVQSASFRLVQLPSRCWQEGKLTRCCYSRPRPSASFWLGKGGLARHQRTVASPSP